MQLNSLFGFLGRHFLQGDDPAATDQGRVHHGAFASFFGVARNLLQASRSADPADSSPSGEAAELQHGNISAAEIDRLLHSETAIFNGSANHLATFGQESGTADGLDPEAPSADLDPATSDGSLADASEAPPWSVVGGVVVSHSEDAPTQTGGAATEGLVDDIPEEGLVDIKTTAGAMFGASRIDQPLETESIPSKPSVERQGVLPGEVIPSETTARSAASGPTQVRPGAGHTTSNPADATNPGRSAESELAHGSGAPEAFVRSASIKRTRQSPVPANPDQGSGDRPSDVQTGFSRAAQIPASDVSGLDLGRPAETVSDKGSENSGTIPHGASPEVRSSDIAGGLGFGRMHLAGSGHPTDIQLQDESQNATAPNDLTTGRETEHLKTTQEADQTIEPGTHPESSSSRPGPTSTDRLFEHTSETLTRLDGASSFEGSPGSEAAGTSNPDPEAAVELETAPDSKAAADPAAPDHGADLGDVADYRATPEEARAERPSRSSESTRAGVDKADMEPGNTSGSDSEATGGSADFSDQTDLHQTDFESLDLDEVIDPMADAVQAETASIDSQVEDRAAAEISFSPERTTIAGARSASGGQRILASRHAGAPWFQPALMQSLRSMPLQAGWKTLELQLDDGHGTMTVRARRDEEKVSVAVSFSDPNLRSLAEANAQRLQQVLQSEYESPVDFSLLSDGTGGSPEQDPGASSRGVERIPEDATVGNSTDGRVQNAARPLVAGARNEWIG